MLLSKLYTIPSEDWDNNKMKLYHVHSLKNSTLWNNNDIFDTKVFHRKDSYNLPKKWKESGFETVRQESFPNYPTRFKCLFLCLETSINYWKTFLNRGIGVQIFEIELINGKLVFVDEAIYNIERFSDAHIKEDACSYWTGEEFVENPIYTGLFEGEFKLKKEM